MVADWSGRLVDERSAPLEGLVVAVEHAVGQPRGRLAQASSGPDGSFRIPGFPTPQWEAPLDLELALYDPLGLRPLARRPLAQREGGALGELVVRRDHAFGWMVRDASGHAPRLARGNRVEVLQDDAAFAAIEEAVRGAQRTIDLSQLWLEADFTAAPKGREARPLLQHLFDAAARGARVRVILNENMLIRDSGSAVESAARTARVPNFEVQRFPLSPNVMHVKTLVVDGKLGFVVGPPFQKAYWDTERHLPREARRGREQPIHDMCARIEGPALALVHELFESLWNVRARATHAVQPVAPLPAPAPAGDQVVQLVRTLPPSLLPEAPRGETTILDAYLRAIANARDYLYIETQYYTSPTISEALARALRRRPSLQVILVLNEDTDVPTYIRWQKRRLREMGHPHVERLGVFVLRSPRPVYVHSKLALADDAWLTVGTANLDSMSLETADEFAAPIDPNVDANVVLLDGIEGAPATGVVASTRRRLWAEHLADEGVWGPRPADGWLGLWRRVAERNLESLRAGRRLVGHVLPYAPEELARAAPDG